MALSPVTPADSAEVVPAPTDRACDTVSKFIQFLTQWDLWINFAVNDDGTATQDYLDWIGTGTGTTAGTLNAPTGVAATTTRTTDVTVTWNSVSGAVYYNVYRGNGSDTSAMTLLAANVTDPTYVDASAVVGTNYWYAVRAYSGTQISAMSAAVTGVVAVDTSGGGAPAPHDENYSGATSAYTYVIPAGFHFMEVHAFGAGGYGAKRDGPTYEPALTPGSAIGDGGGGGSGSYNHVTRIPVAPGDTFTIRVGVSSTTSAVNTYVYKGAETSATYVSAPGGGAGTKGSGYSPGAGGTAGPLGTNTFGGGSVNESDREAGHAGQSGRSSYGTRATGGAALSKSGMTGGEGGSGSYLANTADANLKGTDGYVRLTLTAT